MNKLPCVHRVLLSTLCLCGMLFATLLVENVLLVSRDEGFMLSSTTWQPLSTSLSSSRLSRHAVAAALSQCFSSSDDTPCQQQQQQQQQQQNIHFLLKDTIGDIQERVNQWKSQLPTHYQRAKSVDTDFDDKHVALMQDTAAANKRQHHRPHNHFFPFDPPMASCRSLIEVGGDQKKDPASSITTTQTLRTTANSKQQHPPPMPEQEYEDGRKMICGLDNDDRMANGGIFQREGCVIYSVGSNSEWSFEKDMLKRTKCEVHTFDCTGPIGRFLQPSRPRHKRFFFHHKCLGPEHRPAPPFRQCQGRHDRVCGETLTLQQMQQRLNHTSPRGGGRDGGGGVDLVKMDIEGFEIPLFHSWWQSSSSSSSSSFLDGLPTQILVEVHYCTFDSLAKDIIRSIDTGTDSSSISTDALGASFSSSCSHHHNDAHSEIRKAGPVAEAGVSRIQTAKDLVTLQSRLLDLGYVVVSKQDNSRCLHCTELVLVRYRR